jgi:fructose 5-dehydrogenase cytochrome subunit
MKIAQRIALTAALTFGALAPSMASADDFSPELIERGSYLATASDCIACHTGPGGKPMAGGLPIVSPVGTIVSTNITPSKAFGIGSYTETQFANAVRKGVRADGANLYPAMPYTSYSVMRDEDIQALYAYFMKGVKPVEERSPETKLPFPMNIRASMMGWNLVFRNDKPLANAPQKSVEWNRGRYLVEGAAHCGACHTPRGFFMQEKTDRFLSGSQVGSWYAPDITSDKVTGIGTWTQEDLVTYLRTGRILGKALAAGSMAEAISHSLSHLSDADLNAISTYIRGVPSTKTAPQASAPARFGQGKTTNELAGFRGQGFANGTKGDHAGAQLYSANCASCHGYNAQGTKDGYYPSLFHNSANAGDNPSNLIAVILSGVDRETTDGHVFMPPFGDQPNAINVLGDAEVALLANYIFKNHGNPNLKVTPEDVRVIREGGPRSNLLAVARIGMGTGAVLILLLTTFAWFVSRSIFKRRLL